LKFSVRGLQLLGCCVEVGLKLVKVLSGLLEALFERGDEGIPLLEFVLRLRLPILVGSQGFFQLPVFLL